MGEIRSSFCKEFTSRLPRSTDFLFFLCLLLKTQYYSKDSSVSTTEKKCL